LARLRPAIGRSQRLLLGLEQKSQKASQNGAFGPSTDICSEGCYAEIILNFFADRVGEQY
jgi:hypothetical protein